MLRMTKGQKSQALLGACCMRLRPGLGRARNGTKGPGLEGLPTLSRCKGETLQCLWCCGCFSSSLFSVEAPSRLTTNQPSQIQKYIVVRMRLARAECSELQCHGPYPRWPGPCFVLLFSVQNVYRTSRRSRASSIFVHDTAVQKTCIVQITDVDNVSTPDWTSKR